MENSQLVLSLVGRDSRRFNECSIDLDKEAIERAARALFEFLFSRTRRADSNHFWETSDQAVKDGFRREAAVAILAAWPVLVRLWQQKEQSSSTQAAVLKQTPDGAAR